MITAAQSRGARGLLDWSQSQLAERSNLSESTIRNFEKGRKDPSINNLAAIRTALESAGIQFLEGGTVSTGAGVALKAGTDDTTQFGGA